MPAEIERAWSILTSFEEFIWEAVGIWLVTVSNIEQAEGTYTLMMMSQWQAATGTARQDGFVEALQG